MLWLPQAQNMSWYDNIFRFRGGTWNLLELIPLDCRNSANVFHDRELEVYDSQIGILRLQQFLWDEKKISCWEDAYPRWLYRNANFLFRDFIYGNGSVSSVTIQPLSQSVSCPFPVSILTTAMNCTVFSTNWFNPWLIRTLSFLARICCYKSSTHIQIIGVNILRH